MYWACTAPPIAAVPASARCTGTDNTGDFNIVCSISCQCGQSPTNGDIKVISLFGQVSFTNFGEISLFWLTTYEHMKSH
jgi:hypothetical protein